MNLRLLCCSSFKFQTRNYVTCSVTSAIILTSTSLGFKTWTTKRS